MEWKLSRGKLNLLLFFNGKNDKLKEEYNKGEKG